ncbi:hypothetical protein PIB30_090695, partial [Stylosanthes scabra]|nr:hypothetical protein [Stylosanthes scabra]
LELELKWLKRALGVENSLRETKRSILDTRVHAHVAGGHAQVPGVSKVVIL